MKSMMSHGSENEIILRKAEAADAEIAGREKAVNVWKEGTYMKLEMHLHTAEGSPCAQISAEEVVRSYRKTDYDGIVITNHFDNDLLKDFGSTDRERMDRYLLGYDNAYEAGIKCGLTVILGIEIRLEPYAEDFLIYGVDRDFLYTHPNLCFLTQQELYKLCHKNGALLYQAHPFRPPCRPRNPAYLDGIEFNQRPGGENHNELLGAWICDHPDLKHVSGSDFHTMDNLGFGDIVLEQQVQDSKELADYLKDHTPHLIIKGRESL